MKINAQNHSIDSGRANTGTGRNNWWNRIHNAIFSRNNANDINEHEPLLTSTDSSRVRRFHQIAVLDGEGEYCKSDQSSATSLPGDISCCNTPSPDSTSLPSSLTNSLDSGLKKSSKDKDKCIVDVPLYGSIQENGRLRRQSSRRSLRERRGYKQYMGLVLTLMSSVFSSLSGLTVKLLENDYHPYNICVWRFGNILITATCYLCVSRLWSTRPIWPRSIVEEKYEQLKNICILMLRGILGCSGRILYIYSITCLSLADGMVIASSTPVVMSFFAYFLIGEACGVIPVFIGFLTMAGVTIIARPPFLTGNESYNTTILLGTLTGISGMLLTTLVMITMRKLRHVHHSLITISFAFFGLISSLVLSLYSGVFAVPVGYQHIIIMYFSGLTSFFGQTFLTLGLKYEDAGPVALLKNFDVIFAFIWEFAFLGVSPDVYSLGGGCLVIFCIVLTTVRKWLSSLPEEDEIRSTFSLMLK